jgi:predicted DNA-binding transcriptional regulator AlpA
VTTTLNPEPGARFLSIARVCDKLSRKKSWLYAQVEKDPTFPRPLRINSRQVFVEQDIDAWVFKKVDQSSEVAS